MMSGSEGEPPALKLGKHDDAHDDGDASPAHDKGASGKQVPVPVLSHLSRVVRGKGVFWRSKHTGAVARELSTISREPAEGQEEEVAKREDLDGQGEGEEDEEGAAPAAQWSSRTVFVLAAVGSAIGFGNVWRFPYLVHEYGGGTFLVPYVIALFCFGIPTLVLEMSLGQLLQRTTVEAFEFMSVRWRGLGWACCLTTFSIVIYYTCLLSWACAYMVLSFRSDLPWKDDSQQFFDTSLLQKSNSLTDITHVVPHVVLGYAVLWLFLWFSLTSGTESIGRLVTVTMPLPFIVVAILFFRGITLEGAGAGLQKLFQPDLDKLFDVDVWSTAFAQIFFSIGVGEGIMITYSSFNKKSDPYIVSNCLIVALANCGFSLVAATALFAFLGHLAHEKGVPIDEVVEAGPGLTFVVFPQVLLMLPATNLLTFLFFLMLVCLGISSAVSMVEPLVSAVLRHYGNDVMRLNIGIGVVQFRLTRVKVVTGACVTAFTLGLLLCTDAGTYWLELFDKALPMFTPLTVILLQSFAVRYSIGLEGLIAQIRETTQSSRFESWWLFSWKYATPVVLGLLILLESETLLVHGFGDFPGWAVAIGVLLAFGPVLMIPVMAMRTGSGPQSRAGASARHRVQV